MKNVKSLYVSNSDKNELSFLKKIVLGLMELKVRWINDFGYDSDRMIIEGENEDAWMSIDDDMVVRYEFNDELYYLEQKFGGRFYRVGAFSLEGMDSFGDTTWNSDWNTMEGMLSDNIYEEEESVVDALEDLERLIFREEELGRFQKKVKGYSWKSMNEKVVEFNGDDVDVFAKVEVEEVGDNPFDEVVDELKKDYE